MSGVIYTKNCVFCGGRPVVASGHVVRRDTFIKCGEYLDLAIIACRCEEHKNECGGEFGDYGEYKEWMGMCDDPFLFRLYNFKNKY